MGKRSLRIGLAFVLAAYVATHLMGHAHAQSSLGIGAAEATVPQSGIFGGLMTWIALKQQEFYRALTGSLRMMRDGSGQPWLLIGLSFAYGVFHAAGPGHGKAVISSYMIANEVALRRGVLLSFLSAFLQAITAIVMIGAIFLFLRGTSITTTVATRWLEIASYGIITAFGAWLLWRKAWPPLRTLVIGAPVRSLSSATATAHVHGPSCGHDHAHGHQHHHHAHDHHEGHAHHHGHDDHDHGHHHGSGEVCSTCGHAHMPDPALLSAARFDWRSAWTAVAAVGLRPCTGALVVLTFAFLNGLWIGGLLSVFAMAVGTAITVSALAIMAVTAKNWAVAIAGDGRAGNRVHMVVEIGGAAFLFLIGLTLLGASLSV